MSKYEVESNVAVFTIRYRAICIKKDFRGDWRETIDLAYDDAIEHQSGNMSHIVDIEVEQKQKYRLQVNENFAKKHFD